MTWTRRMNSRKLRFKMLLTSGRTSRRFIHHISWHGWNDRMEILVRLKCILSMSPQVVQPSLANKTSMRQKTHWYDERCDFMPLWLRLHKSTQDVRSTCTTTRVKSCTFVPRWPIAIPSTEFFKRSIMIRAIVNPTLLNPRVRRERHMVIVIRRTRR